VDGDSNGLVFSVARWLGFDSSKPLGGDFFGVPVILFILMGLLTAIVKILLIGSKEYKGFQLSYSSMA
jgi:hypothetical protein